MEPGGLGVHARRILLETRCPESELKGGDRALYSGIAWLNWEWVYSATEGNPPPLGVKIGSRQAMC